MGFMADTSLNLVDEGSGLAILSSGRILASTDAGASRSPHMSLIDDFLRLLGTSRTKLRWKSQNRKDQQAREDRAAENRAQAVSYGNKVCPACRHPAGRDDKTCSRCGHRLGSLAGQK